MATHVLDYSWSQGNNNFTNRVEKSADGEFNLDIPVPGASTNLHVIFAIDISQLVSLEMVCDRALTVKTNSSSDPDDTLGLAAGTPLRWHSTCGLDNPLSADVAHLYLTLAAGDDATLKVRTLQDTTP